MRRTNYLVFILLLISQITFGQIYQNMAQPGYKFGRARFDSVLTIPTGLGGLRNITGGQDTGQIRFNVSDSSVYVWNGRRWVKPVGGGVSDTLKLSVSDTAAMLANYAKKAEVALKLNISDTASMLSAYPRSAAVTSALDLKLNITDTIGTGSLYIRNIFTPQENKRFNVKSGRMDSLYASTSAGGKVVGNGGTVVAEWGGGGGANFNFHGFAGYNLNRASSYNARSFTDKNYVDSSLATKPIVSSFAKNAGGDSTILLLSNGTRYAAKDSVGGGSPITIQNGNSLFSTGLTNTGFGSTAEGSNFLGYQAGYEATNAIHSNFLGYQAGYEATFANYSNFLGINAGYGVTGAATFDIANLITSDNAATCEYVNNTIVKWLSGDWTSVTFVSANDSKLQANSDGTCTGYIAVSISYPTTSPFTVGEELISDNGATGTYISDTEVFPLTGDWAASTTVTGQTSGIVADITTSAYITITFTDIRYAEFNSNFFGSNAGIGATNAYNSNFFGYAGNNAINANSSNFFGFSSGNGATNANSSNFFGGSAGYQATNANNSNFLGNNAGSGGTFASGSNFFGQAAGQGATGASYSNFFGYNTGNSTTHPITGANNIIIGTNITTPTAATANSANIGGVLYLTGTYGTTTGNPRALAQTAGKVGINTTTPAASAALEITSTTAGVLIPRMTTTQRDSIATPATGLHVYNTDANTFDYYNGATWGSIGGGGVTVSSYGKNAGGDSTILLLSNGTRYAAKDSIGGGAASQWTTTGSDIYYNTGNVGIGTTAPVSKFNLRSDFAGSGDSSKGIILTNETEATSGTPSYSPPIRLEGRSFITTGAGSVRSVYNLTNITGSSPTGSSTLAFTHSINNSAPTTLFSINPNTGIFSSGTASIFNNTIGNEQWTSNGRVRIASAGNVFNADHFVYNSLSHTQNLQLNTGTFITHDFKGGATSSASNLGGKHIFTNLGGTENWGASSTGSYEGLRVNITESSIPSGQNYLLRAGKGGASFTSLFDITNTGQVMVGTATPVASAALNVTSTTQGVLIPRMTLAQRNAIVTPAAGLEVIVTGETGGEFLSIYNSTTSTWQRNLLSTSSVITNVFVGNGAGSGATTATGSNFFGSNSGLNASSASSSNFFGSNAGSGATSANGSNFFGSNAGLNASGANSSNFFGSGAGVNATNALASNIFGSDAGSGATNANSSNFFGNTAGFGATGASNSNFFGFRAGRNATGASHSNFFGFNVGNSTTHTITGANNILIGTNITTPTAATANSANIGGVLYLTGTYGTTTGNPRALAQTAGKVGINTTTPVASAVLEITSTTAGVLFPRMTSAQKLAIASPVAGLVVYDTTLNKLCVRTASAWETITSL